MERTDQNLVITFLPLQVFDKIHPDKESFESKVETLEREDMERILQDTATELWILMIISEGATCAETRQFTGGKVKSLKGFIASSKDRLIDRMKKKI